MPTITEAVSTRVLKLFMYLAASAVELAVPITTKVVGVLLKQVNRSLYTTPVPKTVPTFRARRSQSAVSNAASLRVMVICRPHTGGGGGGGDGGAGGGRGAGGLGGGGLGEGGGGGLGGGGGEGGEGGGSGEGGDGGGDGQVKLGM